MPSPPLIVTDGFLPAELALQMRRAIDEHFTNPQAHRPETHQVWNYWFVPELYTDLRTNPERVIGHEWAAAFHEALRDRKSTRLNSSHGYISYAVFCLKKKKNKPSACQPRRNPHPTAVYATLQAQA